MNFDGNGGSGHSPISKVVSYGGTIGSFPTNPTMSGGSFSGWYTNPVGGTQIATSQVITSSVTYSAQWLPPVPSFKATFNVVGSPLYGTFGSVSFSLTSSGSITIDW